MVGVPDCVNRRDRQDAPGAMTAGAGFDRRAVINGTVFPRITLGSRVASGSWGTIGSVVAVVAVVAAGSDGNDEEQTDEHCTEPS